MDTAVLRFFEALRCPLLDALFQAFSALGEETAVAAAVALVYICFSRRTGEQALVTLLCSSCCAAALKGGVRRLRPWAAGSAARSGACGAPAFACGADADRSFPSGHTAASGAVYPALALRIRRLPAALFCTLLPLFIGCARVYLGAHYPSDVLAGLALGLLSALAWQYVYARHYAKRLYLFAAYLFALLPLLFFPQTATEQFVRVYALSLGALAGMLLEQTCARLADAPNFWRRALRLAADAVFTAAVFFPLRLLAGTAAALAAAAFTAAGIAPVLLKKWRL